MSYYRSLIKDMIKLVQDKDIDPLEPDNPWGSARKHPAFHWKDALLPKSFTIFPNTHPFHGKL